MQPYDLLVIGGGIVGCGIARDAALRGLRVVLFEKEDFGYGTSSRSTRLIHGGLRYLEQADFDLVRQDLRERERLLKNAPHRVRPLPFLVPLYRRSFLYRLRLRAGMGLYDLLSYDKSLPKYRFLNREATLRAEPGLNPDGLQGAALYYDAQCAFVERLCLDNVLDAVENGAEAFNHTEVIGLLREGARVVGLTVRDRLSGEEREARGNIVVNASGPWVDRLNAALTQQKTPRLRLTKGIHFAAPPAVQNALVLFSETDGRLFFVIPWQGQSWVGTTDTDFDGDLDTAWATGAEVRYLRDGVRPVLPHADWETIHYTSAGVRALVRENAEDAHASEVSRKHRLVVHTAGEGLEGMISVLGGKITAYRDIAEETVEAAYREHCRRLVAEARTRGVRMRLRSLPPCATRNRSLPGGDTTDIEALKAEIRAEAAPLGLTEAQADNLTFLYGTRARRLLTLLEAQPELRQPLTAPYPDLRAEILYAVQNEFARTASDFLMRRSALAFTPDQGRAALKPVLHEMAALLHWSPERQESERAAYQSHISLTQAFRSEL